MCQSWTISNGKIEENWGFAPSWKAFKFSEKILQVRENTFINHILSLRGTFVIYSRPDIITLLEEPCSFIVSRTFFQKAIMFFNISGPII